MITFLSTSLPGGMIPVEISSPKQYDSWQTWTGTRHPL